MNGPVETPGRFLFRGFAPGALRGRKGRKEAEGEKREVKFQSTRTWPVRPRSSMIWRISAWVIGAVVASRRQERSTWRLRSWPERSLGINLEPKRFQDSEGQCRRWLG